VTVDRAGEQQDWMFSRGDTWTFDFQFNVPSTGSPSGAPADLTGSTWSLQVREVSKDATGKIDGAGGLFAEAAMSSVQQSQGYVVATVPASATAAAKYGKRVYIYDLEQQVGALRASPAWGYITIRADQTR
jgi:hypothetical protein